MVAGYTFVGGAFLPRAPTVEVGGRADTIRNVPELAKDTPIASSATATTEVPARAGLRGVPTGSETNVRSWVQALGGHTMLYHHRDPTSLCWL